MLIYAKLFDLLAKHMTMIAFLSVRFIIKFYLDL